ncbi:hypothetical protein [Mesorhizobium sp. M0478]|uniref:hypothetical protein n=1 Tax=Mesorhizobium sp. M0478 TaxID=2956947 RepID=UPI003336339A
MTDFPTQLFTALSQWLCKHRRDYGTKTQESWKTRKCCIEALKFADDAPEIGATYPGISPDSDPNEAVTFRMTFDVITTAAVVLSIMDAMEGHHEDRELDKYLDRKSDRSGS